MGRDALIIGGSRAGVRAALDLADSGIHVHLITVDAFVGDSTGADPAANHPALTVAGHPRVAIWPLARLQAAQGEPGAYRVNLHQLPRYVDLTRCTACGDCITVCPVTVPGTQQRAVSLAEGAQPGCAVIDKQGKSPCAAVCPGGIPVQGYVALIAQGRFREALDLIEAAIPFPGICGRVCTHPCESNCRRGQWDDPIAIRHLKRFVADWALTEPETPSLPAAVPADAQQVAVVGAGPAGMAAAQRLAKAGHRVTVFEKLPIIGGMMGIGIPAYRLPRDIIRREYRRIEALGVDLRLNTSVGPDGDLGLDDLFDRGYRAVCLTIGAHSSLPLHLPGENLPGVVHGIELLKTISLSQQSDDPAHRLAAERMLPSGSRTRAAVLGGGNTAMDAARSLKRLGFKTVEILYRRSRNEMPALAEEIEETEREGVRITYLTAPVRMLGDERTGVTGLECVRMRLAEPDDSGRQRPVPIAGSEFRLDVDRVVLAIGQVPDPRVLGERSGVSLTREGRIKLKGHGFMTDTPGVFAAGDAVTRDRMSVIEAIGMGKRAADEIDAYLRERPAEEEKEPLPVAAEKPIEPEPTKMPRVPIPMLPIEDRLQGFPEVEKSYTDAEARAEAGRCLACGPCSECMACVNVCKPGAVLHDQRESSARLDIGAILFADHPERFVDLPVAGLPGVLQARPENPAEGSAAAARALFDLFVDPRGYPSVVRSDPFDTPVRLGVFVCLCGEEIASIIDTDLLCERAAAWPNVAYRAQVPFSCSREGAETIREAVNAHGLNRVVLAACSCCSLDQVCYGCTFQRIRCKRHLGILGDAHIREMPTTGLAPEAHAMVNIREQCAWPHADDPKAATAKATALVAAAVGSVRSPLPLPEAVKPPPLSVMVIGGGDAGDICLDWLRRRKISASRMAVSPDRIRRIHGGYEAVADGHRCDAVGVVLAPSDTDERVRLLAAARMDLPGGSERDGWVSLKPGVFFCDPDADGRISGTAAGAGLTAWFGRSLERAGRNWATVDPDRCRTCHTCVQTCEIGAAEIVETPRSSAWIDPMLCTGCGSCAARCPSNAIGTGPTTDTGLEAILDAVLY